MIALTSPLVLAALPPLAGLFIYAYLRHGRGKKVTVASVMFLRKLPRISSARRKLHIPWKLILELTCLALLLLGLAGLYREQLGTRVVLVIDNSLSSGATLRANGETALAASQRRAQQELGELDTRALVTVVATSPVNRELNPTPITSTQARELVTKMEPGFGSDGLEGILARYLGDPQVDRLLVFSDRRIQGEQSTKRLQLFNPLSSDDSRQNIAISDLNLFESEAGRFGVEVTLNSYAKQSYSGELLLQSVLLSGELRDLGKQRVSLGAHSNQSVRFSSIEDAKAIKVSLVSSKDVSLQAQNVLPDDDYGYLTREVSGANILLVGPLSAQALGLEGLRGLKFNWLDSKSLSAAALEAGLKNARGVIFHRVTPATLPDKSSLFVVPPSDSTLFPPNKDSQGGPVARWNATHPLLKYINLATLSLKRSATFSLPPWGEQLLSLPQGVVLFGGETRGNRYVVSGFELFPFEGKTSPVLSIMTLNMFNWLFNASGNTTSMQPGALVPQMDGALSANLLPSNHEIKIGQVVPQPGVLVLTNNKADSKLYAYNFFSAVESDLENTAPISLVLSAESVKSSRQAEPLKMLLALMLVALLGAELAFRLNSLRLHSRKVVR